MTTIGIKGYYGKTRRLVHATSYVNAFKIFNSKIMYSGKQGLFGAGIYFAKWEKDAIHKCAGDGTAAQAIIRADVKVGRQWVLEGNAKYLNKNQVQNRNCDSVKGRSQYSAGWEYVIYDSNQISVIEVEYLKIPFLAVSLTIDSRLNIHLAALLGFIPNNKEKDFDNGLMLLALRSANDRQRTIRALMNFLEN
jgi:hypothetical protein